MVIFFQNIRSQQHLLYASHCAAVRVFWDPFFIRSKISINRATIERNHFFFGKWIRVKERLYVRKLSSLILYCMYIPNALWGICVKPLKGEWMDSFNSTSVWMNLYNMAFIIPSSLSISTHVQRYLIFGLLLFIVLFVGGGAEVGGLLCSISFVSTAFCLARKSLCNCKYWILNLSSGLDQPDFSPFWLAQVEIGPESLENR